jgi:hypothetical protein
MKMALDMTAHQEDIGLSAVLRKLAVDARRILAYGPTDPADAVAITRRIRSVREQVQPYPSSTLQRWLDGLERKVQGLDGGRVAS